MRIFVAVVILALFATPLLTAAESMSDEGFSVEGDIKLETTEDLYSMCTVDKDHPLYTKAAVFCLGFITGAVHYHEAISKGPDIEPIVCPDKEISRFELAEVFIEWVENHPEFMNVPPVEGLVRSVVDKWPCKKSE